MAAVHVLYRAKYLQFKNEMCDLQQQFLLKACLSEYKPNMCAPKTWFTKILISIAPQIYMANNAKGRFLAMPGRECDVTEAGSGYVNTASNGVTPLDYLEAQETVGEFEMENVQLQMGGGIALTKPKGFKGFRGIKENSDRKEAIIKLDSRKSKRCSRCPKSKKLKEFTMNCANNDGLSTWCRSCKAKGARRGYLKKKRLLKQNA